jgi:hypothetical protein
LAILRTQACERMLESEEVRIGSGVYVVGTFSAGYCKGLREGLCSREKIGTVSLDFSAADTGSTVTCSERALIDGRAGRRAFDGETSTLLSRKRTLCGD